jgi:hypothetical protein
MSLDRRRRCWSFEVRDGIDGFRRELTMTSEAQLAANRFNALKSTGPRTAAGKAVVAVNGIKHGLLSREIVLKGEREVDLVDFGKRLRTQLEATGGWVVPSSLNGCDRSHSFFDSIIGEQSKGTGGKPLHWHRKHTGCTAWKVLRAWGRRMQALQRDNWRR